MSHTTKIATTPIRDVMALRTAVKNLQSMGVKIKLLEGTSPRMFYSNQLTKHLGRQDENCDFVLRLEDSNYDVGLIKNSKGVYEPVFDSWDGQVQSQLGNNIPSEEHCKLTKDELLTVPISKFMMEYTKEATINQAVSDGYIVDSCELDINNEYVLTLSVD